jgi:hypothetical protein
MRAEEFTKMRRRFCREVGLGCATNFQMALFFRNELSRYTHEIFALYPGPLNIDEWLLFVFSIC